MRLTVDVVREPGGRIHGHVCAADGTSDSFDGVLDLLRIVEGHDLTPRAKSSDGPDGPDGPAAAAVERRP